MPIILELQYEDSTNYIIRIPAEIWRKIEIKSQKYLQQKTCKVFQPRPQLETADINLINNNWPRKTIKSKFELYKNKKNNRRKNFKENKMQRYNRLKKMQQSTIE